MLNGSSLYIMMHKPRGFTSSRERDSQTDQIVFDLLPVSITVSSCIINCY